MQSVYVVKHLTFSQKLRGKYELVVKSTPTLLFMTIFDSQALKFTNYRGIIIYFCEVTLTITNTETACHLF